MQACRFKPLPFRLSPDLLYTTLSSSWHQLCVHRINYKSCVGKGKWAGRLNRKEEETGQIQPSVEESGVMTRAEWSSGITILDAFYCIAVAHWHTFAAAPYRDSPFLLFVFNQCTLSNRCVCWCILSVGLHEPHAQRDSDVCLQLLWHAVWICKSSTNNIMDLNLAYHAAFPSDFLPAFILSFSDITLFTVVNVELICKWL